MAKFSGNFNGNCEMQIDKNKLPLKRNKNVIYKKQSSFLHFH